MMFLFPRWDILVPRRVNKIKLYSSHPSATCVDAHLWILTSEYPRRSNEAQLGPCFFVQGGFDSKNSPTKKTQWMINIYTWVIIFHTLSQSSDVCCFFGMIWGSQSLFWSSRPWPPVTRTTGKSCSLLVKKQRILWSTPTLHLQK